MDYIVNFSIFNLLLHLFILFFRFFIDSFNFEHLLLHNILGFFSETVAGPLEVVALFGSQEVLGVDEAGDLAFFVLDTCGHF